MKHSTIACLAILAAGLASCSDFFEVDSDSVIYAEGNHLNNATDTVYSIAGIYAQMGALTDRTVLLGEARGDLVDVTSATNRDLRDVATFNIGDDNQFNRPRDYYAVINNCNYFIANADTAKKNNRNEYLFRKEYVMAKTYRAWTYLQLALNYGTVPFVEKPILTKEESERDYPRYDIKTLCDWLIKDLQGLSDIQLTGYGDIGGANSKKFIIPVDLMLGELNLWAEHYREAASAYFRYLQLANGMSKGTPTGVFASEWREDDANYEHGSTGWSGYFTSLSADEDIFTMRSDSLPSQPNYTQLYNVFNSSEENDYDVSLTPSQQMVDLSEAQIYCQRFKSAGTYTTIYPPKNISNTRLVNGDLRLESVWNHNGHVVLNGERKDYRSIDKYRSSQRRITIYRTTMVYLRMIEALNRAGFPRMAHCFLVRGVNNDTIAKYVTPYYPDHAAYINSFSFPRSIYKAAAPGLTNGVNMLGIHDRGCGWSAYNEKPYGYYDAAGKLVRQYGAALPVPADSCSAADSTAYQIPLVEDMIIDECALELAFEGTRFYDLMRVALRRGDPAYLADRVKARRGQNADAGIQADLTNKSNWYMKLK